MNKLRVLCLVWFAICAHATAYAQQEEPPCNDFTIFAWVDPNHGVDPLPPVTSPPPLNQETALTRGLNDPTQPYKTLQQAIDAVYWGLVQGFTTNSNAQGVVYALPGLYGSHPGGSGDVLPIKIRDRVHVQGMGARTCIVRGYDAQPGLDPPILWPTAPDCDSGSTLPSLCNPGTSHPPHSPGLSKPPDTKVLFDCRYITPAAPFPAVPPSPGATPPWFNGPYLDTVERIDGFTFEGGDMQIVFGNFESLTYEVSAHVSNCVFDMRDNWIALQPDPHPAIIVKGPHFGIAMNKEWDEHIEMYFEQNILIASNTFVMAEYQQGGSVVTTAIEDAVAIIDYTDPNCHLGPHQPGPLLGRDPDDSIRGIGRPLLVNNLIRTLASAGGTRQMAMLGLDRIDTWVGANTSPTGPPSPATFDDSNAFAPGRVHTLALPPSAPASNCVFWSLPCRLEIPPHSVMTAKGTAIYTDSSFPSTSVPMAVVPLWFGVPGASESDPGFVGEYLSDPTGGGVTHGPRDRRLMPGSPMIDVGFAPAPGEFMWTAHGPVGEPGRRYEDSDCSLIQAFRWDGEEYGNPRIVGDKADIGFDELHLFIMASSYANDTNSHNFPSPLNTSSTQGTSTRFMLLPEQSTVPPGSTVKVKGAWANPPIPFTAWNQPPGTLAAPRIKSDPLPVYFNTRYITWDNPGPVTKNPASGTPSPWTYTLPTQSNTWNNMLGPAAQLHRFFQVIQADIEPTAPPPPLAIDLFLYYNTQVEVIYPDMVTKLWSNLQAEYR